jgi:putative transposase
MSQKLEFVERVAKGEKVAALCREFGVSRETGHKWVKRFRERGYEGLEEQSRRPKAVPLATAEELVIATLQARDAHPRWGPIKLHGLLRRRFGEQTPSSRTIARILRKANVVRERRKRRPISVVERAPSVVAQAPNDVWTVDFKGWWHTLNGDRCEPLTVRDAHSRYLLAVVVCSTKKRDVRPVFEKLFRRHGLPRAIQCDNGVPFVAVQARAGLSSLSAWWVSMGIRLVRSRPGCPQDNGAHERMHADVRADVQARPAATRDEQQRVIDRWRQEFNHVRPHQALGGKTPAEVYKVGEHRRGACKAYTYPKHFYVRRVGSTGCLRFRGDSVAAGSPFRGLSLGIEIIDAVHVRLWLHDVDLGVLETMPAVDDACFATTMVRRPRRPSSTPPLPTASAPAPASPSLASSLRD